MGYDCLSTCFNYILFIGTAFALFIGPFDATAVLVYGAIRSLLAQPRNLIGGHVLSALDRRMP